MKNKKNIVLTRDDLIREMARRINRNENFGGEIYLYQLRIIFDTLVDVLKDIILGEMELVIRGFGKLEIKEIKPKKYIHFETKRSMVSKPVKIAVFKLSGKLRNLLK